MRLSGATAPRIRVTMASPPASHAPQRHGPSPARTETLADGVFAIAMTLLVFDLKLPTSASDIHTSGDLYAYVWSIGWNIVTFVMSFLVMGVYWVGHHYMFLQVKRVDRPFVWINIGFLLLVALLPFSTGLLGQYYELQAAIVIYAAHLTAIAVMFLVLILYATHDKRLTADDLDPNIARFAIRRVAIAPFFSLIAIGISFWSPRLAFALFPLLLIPAILPGAVDRLLSGRRP